MTPVKDNYQLLIEKLDQFIRKYYLNQLIRGTLYALGLILFMFITFNVVEYFGRFPGSIRKVMFFSFIGITLATLAYWVFTPLLHYFQLGKLISHKQAAQIIGQHFTNVKDKLLNILQLKELSSSDQTGRELILASINQKSEEIKPVPFRSAINLSQNRKYLRYALPPLLLLLILLLAAPSVIKDSTNRLIKNNREFEREAPFSFLINQDELEVVQYSDYELVVNVDGEVLPDEMFIDIDNYKYRLTKKDASTFSYTFKNVNKNIDFFLMSSGFSSMNYELKVLEKPNILGFEVKLDYPSYTGRKDQNLNNIGDLVVPAGTKIDWLFNVENTDQLNVRFAQSDKPVEVSRISEDIFNLKWKALRDDFYKLFISNEQLPTADSVTYTLTVQPDLYPTISVEKFIDSTDTKLMYFVGDASDDYGLSGLYFNYRIINQEGQQGELQKQLIRKASGKQLQYDYQWDIREVELDPGEQLTYYFEVFDNDAVNGSKSARTGLMTFAKPTLEEFQEMNEKNNEDIKEELKKSIEESKKIQDDMDRLREKLLQEKELDWQNREELEKLMERQKELEKKIEQAKEKFEENLKNQEEFEQPDEELMEKQEQLQEMFEELMSDEMKELMKQIEELMQELEKENALEMMEEFKFNDEQMEMEMDRMLELFKQLEMEKEIQDQIEKLEELAERQEELAEETEKKEQEENQDSGEEQDGDEQKGDEQKKDEQAGDKQEEGEKTQEELEKEQEEINKEFEELQKKQEELQEKNKELENPKQMGDEQEQEEQMEDIQEDLQKSQDFLQKQQNKKASGSQKKAAEKMKQMAQQMSASMESGEMEQMQEDMQALRQLLENLVGLSFGQEDLIADFSKTDPFTPRYTDLTQQQFKLQDDFQLVEDSLQALAKRVFQIESFITEKVGEIKSNLRESLDELEERKKDPAAEHQQRAMKNLNDLALMLSEVMNQMQQQMSGMMAGSQMCSKPGGSSPEGSKPMDKISQGQKQLSEQMKQMRDQMQKGKQGSGGMSKEFAEMAAKQAALRKALREMQRGKQKNGDDVKELQEILEQMNQNEIDLVNKRLTNEMMKRQQDILTRLLEAERAERQREFDNKRKSETGENKERELPPSLQEYLKKRQAEVDFYKQSSPSLKPFYKILVDEYYKSLKAQ
jgi:hypothetical protein